MKLNIKNAFLFSAMLLIFTIGTFGQETTGNIEGIVEDANGAIIPDVTVRITNAQNTAGFNRTVVTNQNGSFYVPDVPPGNYSVIASKSGFGEKTVTNIVVVLGKTNSLRFSLDTGAVSAVVDVTETDSVSIDQNDNKIQTNVTQKEIQSLPKGTNIGSLLKVSPATRAEPLSGQFQVDGASGSENTFIIDGQEVSNFRTGVLNGNNNLPFSFVQEVQVKTSGFEAEFGGATGGVINVVTKGGNNDLHGEFGMEFHPATLQAGPRIFQNRFAITASTTRNPPITRPALEAIEYFRPARDRFTDVYPTALLSGPIIKNRLWFLANYSPQFEEVRRTVTYLSSDPRTRTQTDEAEYQTSIKREYAFGRLDAAVTDNFRLSGTYTWNPIIQEGVIPQGAITLGSARPSATIGNRLLTGPDLTDQQGGRQNSNNVSGQAIWTPNSNLIFSFRASRGFLNEKLNSYGLPSGPRYICQLGDPALGCQTGFQNIGNNNQIVKDASTRVNFEGDATFIVNDFLGRHQFKVGYQQFRISNDVETGYADQGIFQFYYGLTINDLEPPAEIPNTNPNAVGAGLLQRFGRIGEAKNLNQSIYVQDSWQPTSRLSFNLGVRFEKEDLPSYNGFAPPINFNWNDKIAPRVGASFDLTGDGKTKLFASYGLFYDRLKFELPRGSFGGEFFRLDYFEILPNTTFNFYTVGNVIGNYSDPRAGECPIAAAPGRLTRCQQDFRIASNDPNADLFTGLVDPDLKPFRQTEFTVGLQRELFKDYLFSARYTFKNVDEAVEDAGFPTATGSEAYIIGNPGKGLHASAARQFGYVKITEPRRRYDALELRFDRRFANNFYFNTNYTYSRLYGNYSGLASSDEAGRLSPGVNRFFDLPFVGYTAGGQEDDGRLATDRPHVFNAFGAYNFDWMGSKTNSTELSFYTTAQSGTPQTSLFSFYSLVSIFNGRGDLGRTPTFTQTDLGLTHRYKFGRDDKFVMSFNVNVLNAFNQAAVTSLFTNVFAPTTGNITGPSFGFENERDAINRLLTNGIISEVNTFLNGSVGGVSRRDGRYKLPNGFQAGRDIRFGFRLNF